ncbi:MAG: delta-aminolevulinic acid dehydratase [Bacteroidales bacterium]|nr:delta-aminolevulinic acid dehydratase [Bacteroidales bacterium]
MISSSFKKLKQYCEAQNFTGWDPYDGLNSKLFKIMQLLHSKWLRLAIIQVNKRSPVNFRRLFIIPKEENPKGLALFLSGYCNLYHNEENDVYLKKIDYLARRILVLQSKGYAGACWGYNFDWQSRAFYLPRYTPTVVATSFVAYALMDAYEITKRNEYLETALSSKNFILHNLNRTHQKDNLFFSYSPLDNSVVYNASLLGCRLLARIYSYTNEKELRNIAQKVVSSCINKQNNDGSWYYGEMKIQRWIDSFHTGYNLESIYEYMKYCNDYTFKTSFDKGLEFYKQNFITEEGIPKYYHNNIYPIDPHSLAQYIRTMTVCNELNDEKDKIIRSLFWLIAHMQSNKGFFYYQKKKYYTIKIPYMRWTQAWMFYAMSHLIKAQIDASY